MDAAGVPWRELLHRGCGGPYVAVGDEAAPVAPGVGAVRLELSKNGQQTPRPERVECLLHQAREGEEGGPRVQDGGSTLQLLRLPAQAGLLLVQRHPVPGAGQQSRGGDARNAAAHHRHTGTLPHGDVSVGSSGTAGSTAGTGKSEPGRKRARAARTSFLRPGTRARAEKTS